MSAYIWSDDLATGNPLIDDQHKQLFTAINNLLDACGSGKGRTVLDSTMKFLSDYTAKHFADEERLQQRYVYPDYANHKRLHEGFSKVVSDLAKELHAQGPTLAVLGKVNANIGNWLVGHIKREDTKVAAFIKLQSA